MRWLLPFMTGWISNARVLIVLDLPEIDPLRDKGYSGKRNNTNIQLNMAVMHLEKLWALKISIE